MRAWKDKAILQGLWRSGMCKHAKVRQHCKECGEAGICENGKQRNRRKDFGRAGIL